MPPSSPSVCLCPFRKIKKAREGCHHHWEKDWAGERRVGKNCFQTMTIYTASGETKEADRNIYPAKLCVKLLLGNFFLEGEWRSIFCLISFLILQLFFSLILPSLIEQLFWWVGENCRPRASETLPWGCLEVWQPWNGRGSASIVSIGQHRLLSSIFMFTRETTKDPESSLYKILIFKRFCLIYSLPSISNIIPIFSLYRRTNSNLYRWIMQHHDYDIWIKNFNVI